MGLLGGRLRCLGLLLLLLIIEWLLVVWRVEPGGGTCPRLPTVGLLGLTTATAGLRLVRRGRLMLSLPWGRLGRGR